MSGFLFDTCAISEVVKQSPNRGLAQWVRAADPMTTFLSVMSIGEVRKGIEKRPIDKRRAFLEAWLVGDLARMFAGRVLSIDVDTADHFCRIKAATESRGITVGVIDALIGATALRHNLTVVTRNAGDFESLGVSVVNPWSFD
jgi:predicted nucleic acid-binding protein